MSQSNRWVGLARVGSTVLCLNLLLSLAPLAVAQDNPLSPKNPLERDTPPSTPAAVAPNRDAVSKPPANAGAASQIVLKQNVMNDPGSGNMPSHTVLAPVGWKVEGGAFWPPPTVFNVLPSQNIKVIAPDGRLVHIGPSIAFKDFYPSQAAMQQTGVQRPAEGGIDGGYMISYLPQDLKQWGTFLEEKAFRKSYPNATNVRLDPVIVVPELTQIMQKNMVPMKQMQAETNRMGGGLVQGSCDCVSLATTAHYDLNGKSWDHMIIFGLSWFNSDSQVGRQILWCIEPAVSYRAPAGELEANMPLLMSIAYSMRPTPEWSKMKADHVAKMNQITAKGNADRAAIIASTNAEISKIITETYNARQASQDRTHNNFIKCIGEVEDYVSPNNPTPVQLPHYYSHVYSNGNGEYVLTNNSLYDPNTDPNVNQHRWETMQVPK